MTLREIVLGYTREWVASRINGQTATARFYWELARLGCPWWRIGSWRGWDAPGGESGVGGEGMPLVESQELGGEGMGGAIA